MKLDTEDGDCKNMIAMLDELKEKHQVHIFTEGNHSFIGIIRDVNGAFCLLKNGYDNRGNDIVIYIPKIVSFIILSN